MQVSVAVSEPGSPTPPLGAGGLVRVDIAGLDDVTPGVTVLAPRPALSTAGARIVLSAAPTVRRVTEIAGLQDLIDIAFTGSVSQSLGASASGGLGAPTIEVRAELTIHADDLHPGDVVDYSGVLHHVTRVDRGAGLAWPVAYDGTGWAMALGHDFIVLHRT